MQKSPVQLVRQGKLHSVLTTYKMVDQNSNVWLILVEMAHRVEREGLVEIMTNGIYLYVEEREEKSLLE